MTEGETPEQGQVLPPEEGLQDKGSLQPSSGDPLDEITDADALRGEAKKFRSIAQRKSQSKEAPAAPAPQPAPQAPNDVVTRQDLNRINTQTAKDLVDAPVRDNWDAILDYVPGKYRNAETPKDIAKGMQLAFEAWQQDNPATPDNPAAELQTSTVTKSSVKPEPSEGRKTQPLIRKSDSMKNWYPQQS